MTVDLTTGLATGMGSDTLNGIKNVNTGTGNDTITGDSAANMINSGAGNDALITSLGADVMDGGDGDDTFYVNGTQEYSTLIGGADANIFIFNALPAQDVAATAGHVTLMTSSGLDTLYFRSFNYAINIDLGKTKEQEVGGLFVTLRGLFKDIFGTLFNDTFTGNTLDNNITGGVEGKTDFDTVWYPAGNDTYKHIEQFLPQEDNPVNPPGNPVAGGDRRFGDQEGGTGGGVGGGLGLGAPIPVTGSGLMNMLLGSASVFELGNGNRVTFAPDLGGYQTSIAQESQDTLPGALPEGRSFVDGLSATLIKDGAALDTMPDGTQMTVSFVNPPEGAVILFWDANTNTWVEVAATLNPDTWKQR